MAAVRNEINMNEERGVFICPECGSTEACGFTMVEGALLPDDPWSWVLQIAHCANCSREIPAHLGDRRGGISIEEAQREWRSVYREKRHTRRRHPML